MTRFLNGQHALEKIPIKEGISRKDCKRVLDAMEKYICIVSSDCVLVYSSAQIYHSYSSIYCISLPTPLFWWINQPCLAILWHNVGGVGISLFLLGRSISALLGYILSLCFIQPVWDRKGKHRFVCTWKPGQPNETKQMGWGRANWVLPTVSEVSQNVHANVVRLELKTTYSGHLWHTHFLLFIFWFI